MAQPRRTVEDMTEVRVRPLRRAEYDVLIDQGVFDEDERIQLLDGELVAISPKTRRTPASSMRSTSGSCRRSSAGRGCAGAAAGGRWEHSEPEPDLAVVPADEPLDACGIDVTLRDLRGP